MTRDPLNMRGSNWPGNLQKDYDKIKIVNTMHKGCTGPFKQKFFFRRYRIRNRTRHVYSNCTQK